MCLRPIKVRNPSRYFREGIDKEYITVPCGKCSECVNANRMDWQIRLYYEHISTEQLHDGFTFYFTLTYNNLCPHLPVRDDKGRIVLCFNHKHIPDFIKRLRTQLIRDDVKMSIRHFISSEYGDSPDASYITDSGRRAFYTHRPHYHGLLFVSRERGCELSIKDAADYIRKLICDKWSFGDKTFTVGYDRFGFPLTAGLVGAAGPIGYCAKYLDKGLNTDEYYQSLINDERFADYLDDLKPKHYQSQGLGRDALSLVDDGTLDAGFIPCPVYDEKSGLVLTRNFRLPLYLMRKVNYDFDKEHGVFVPSERGMRNLPRIMYNQREDVAKSIDDFKTLYQHDFRKGSVFAEKCLEILQNTYNGRFDFDYCNDLYCAFKEYDSRFIANYITFFRDRSVYRCTNDHNVMSDDKASAIISYTGDEVSIQQLMMLGYEPSDIVSMPLGKREYYTEFRNMLRRTFIPCQVKRRDESFYKSVITYHDKMLEHFVALYNSFALTVRNFNSLDREKRVALYKQQRKLLKRAHHKDKLSNSLKVS
ncbi:replication initiator protein [Microvirus sp.]|nr:replication initiator protein [Microvirus sp.]